MLRAAQRRSFFRCVGVVPQSRLWVGACLQSFVSPFASKASRNHHVKLSASQVSSNHGNASVFESTVCRGNASASGNAKISVHNAGRPDAFVEFCHGDVRALAGSRQDAKSHCVDGDAKVFECATRMHYATGQFSNADVRGVESVASPNDDIILESSSQVNDKCLPSDVSSGSSQSLHASLQNLNLLDQTQRSWPDLQEKLEVLDSEQFSISDAKILVKRRAFQSCLVGQLATVLQVLKKSFGCAKVVHDTLVRSSSVILQPAELVQQKLNLLYDFQLNEKVVGKLCCRGRTLLISMASLQERLAFYKDFCLTVEARNTMFSRGPLILSFSIENHVQPILKFFESTGLTKERILILAQRFPDMFYMSLESNLLKKYEHFRQLGFSLTDFPRAFRAVRRCSLKLVEEHVQFLKALGFTDDDVRSMLKRQPAILAFSAETLKPKVDFLICEQKRCMAEIVHNPNCLTYSLQRRIVPRFNAVKESCHSKVYSLSYILDVSDSTFTKRFGK